MRGKTRKKEKNLSESLGAKMNALSQQAHELNEKTTALENNLRVFGCSLNYYRKGKE